jgi:hypothetical protein
MNLNDTLKQFEAVEANLAKLDEIWKQIAKMLPSINDFQVDDQDAYLQFVRSFEHIAKPMPKIDGFELKITLAHPDEIFRMKVFSLDGELTDRAALDSDLHQQGEILADYRFRLGTKRRELARQAVHELCAEVEAKLRELKESAEHLKHNAPMPKEKWKELSVLFKSIDALLGKTFGRPRRWNDMARHLSFGVKTDYDDIVNHDWPEVREWLDGALYTDSDPVPVTATDLGDLVASKPHGPVATELNWQVLTPADFERLVFNLIDQTKNYENPKWLTHTNAPDRGRDLSVDRMLRDSLAGSRKQRVILACKHTDSVNLKTVAELVAQMKLWEPPRVDELIIVTTGRFTTDAIDWIEKHNNGSNVLRLEMWPDSQLERLLARRPELIAEFRLRS